MAERFRTTRRAEFHQTDAAGIVHFSQFFLWMEQVEHEFLRQLGWSVITRLDDRTISWPRVASSCEFHRPVRFEQIVTVDLSVAELKRTSVTYRSEFSLDEHAIARGTMTAVCCQIDEHGNFSSTAIPPSLRTELEKYLVEPHGSTPATP